MNESDYQVLVEQAARRPLRAEEHAQLRAYLAEHPDAQADWEAEAALNRLLCQLPPVPVSSNFTAQVMHVAMRTKARRHHRRRVLSLRWLWSFGRAWQGVIAVLVAGLALLAYSQHRIQSHAELARNVATISALAPLPSLEVFQDFDSVKSLPAAPLADEDELLAALK
jgi:anti-sigma factor RsiW